MKDILAQEAKIMKIQLQKADQFGNLYWTEPEEMSDSSVTVVVCMNTVIQWREVA